MPEISNIVASLESLGLSNYEAKAYTGLLSENPVTGYKLSKVSGVPRSRIYETLEKLYSKGLVLIQDSEPKNYTPIAVEEFFNKVKLDILTNMKTLRADLEELGSSKGIQPGIWNIQGRKNILAKADYLIKNAENSILICAWNDDLKELQIPLEEALKNGNNLNIITFGSFELEGFDKVYPQFRDIDLKSDCRDFTMIIDKNEVFYGATMPFETCKAVITQETSLVYIAREYLMMKVALGKMLDSIPDDIRKGFDSFYNIQKE
ncbi:MAG: TrmB family transcriptional regulator [bacterium]|nr:TrmB family transcriptional regulator [bacterium]